MNSYELIFEALANLAALVLGIILIARARDNRVGLWWGVLSVTVGVIMLVDNSRLIFSGIPQNITGESYGLLVMRRMLEWFVGITAAFLFPFTTLRPTYITPLRVTLFLIPVGITVLAGVCYIWFNGYFTPLDTFAELQAAAGEFDVRLRLAIFALTIIIPLCYFFIPALSDLHSVRRKAAPMMAGYIFGLIVILCYYVLFTLFVNGFIFSTFGVVIMGFTIWVSIMHLRHENPLSHRLAVQDAGVDEGREATYAEMLFGRMTEYFSTAAPFVDPAYSPDDLARDLNARRQLVIEAIRAGGFTGFREYMNFLRIERFKALALADRTLSVKQLMNRCGFASRSTFYRAFSESEGTTPTQFIMRA